MRECRLEWVLVIKVGDMFSHLAREMRVARDVWRKLLIVKQIYETGKW